MHSARALSTPCIMGCTSSAPKTLSATPSKEDKGIQFGEDGEENLSRPIEVIGTETENRNEINVLPLSDTENVQLVRNNQSTTSLKPEKDLYTNGHIVETENIDPSETTSGDDDHNDDTKLKLEEVVGKFIEIVQHDTCNENDGANTDAPAESQEDDKDKQGNNQTGLPNENNDEEEHDSNLEESEDASPTQSQSSRATRWEALADIAAELPPSLAVDPLTGQIYSLSK